MGRIMSFGQDGQLVRDFDKSEYDFLRRYGRTPDEVMAENVKLREVISDAEESARLILDESRALEAENARLREELAKARDPQRIGGTADPKSFVYAIEQLREFRWQHATNDEEAIPYINNVADAHERENDRLRELLRDMYEMAYPEYPSAFDAAFADRMRELGVMCE